MHLPMTFLWPQYLWLLLVVPGLVVAYLWLLRRKKRIVLRYASLAVVRQASGQRLHWRRHVPPALFLLAIAAMLVAASRPLAVITLPSSQRTVVLAIDVSLSMAATDVKPNRMMAAQDAARAFLKQLPKNVKVAIVTFAGSAQLVQPATLDREDLLAAIDRFQMQRGTAIGSGIVVALAELFPDQGLDLGEMTYGQSAPRSRSIDDAQKAPRKEFVPVQPGSYESAAILLLTDGRRTTGIETLEAARMAADRGVRVYSVGLGTVDGVVSGYEGMAFYMRLDEPALRAVAQTTQGEYFHAGTAETLRRVYERLGARMVVEKKEVEISALLALLGAVLSLLAAALSLMWFHRIL